MKLIKNKIVSVDIGGTFCDASYEHGSTFRSIKILSHGQLRAKIRQISDLKTLNIEAAWGLPFPHVLKGCILFSPKGKLTRIVSYVPTKGILKVESTNGYFVGDTIEIGMSAEAPIFAAHLLTGISTHQSLKNIELRIGTTKGTNALLEMKGTPCIWITNQGFGDLLYIKSQQRPHLFQLNIPEPKLLHRQVIETLARINARGKIITPLNHQELKRIQTLLPNDKTIPIAISLLNSYKNPVHELLIQKTLHRMGYRYLSCSASLLPTIHLLPRSETAVCNAYLSPILHRFISSILSKVKADQLFLISSSGQAIPAKLYQPKDSLFSGPAGGIKAAEWMAASYGMQKIITFDMGGTSTDTARIEKKAVIKFKTKIDQIEIASPTFDIETVAAGGGSIIDFEDGRFKVGPESAGADPGPACYGRGGPFTLTDLNLLLGRLVDHCMSIPIDRNKSLSAWLELFKKTGTKSNHQDQTLILEGIARIADEKMAEAVRKITLSQGHDPAHFNLLVYGGAGGLHACAIADILHISTILIPCTAGIFSATGMSKALVEHTLIKQINSPLDAIHSKLKKFYQLLYQEYNELDYVIHERKIHLKYQGQNHTMVLDWRHDLNLKLKFKTLYKKQFGSSLPNIIEVDKIQINLIKKGKIKIIKKRRKSSPKARKINHASISWHDLNAGDHIPGPLTIYHREATVYLAKNWEATIQENKDLLLNKQIKSVELKNYSSTIELELFSNRFKAIAEQMGVQLQHSAFSVNVKERLDFSCAILDAEARLIANAPHIPVHLGSLGVCARLILKKYPLKPGDIILCNHPKYGGSHLPDLTVLKGVFDRERRLIGYVINRAHHAEIGGMTPGSMPPFATCLDQEGVVFLPTYIQRDGLIDWPLLKKFLTTGSYPTRDVHSNMMDLKAAIDALSTGEKRLIEWNNQYGYEYVQNQMDRILSQGSLEISKFITQHKNKKFKATELLDDGRKIQVIIHVKEHKILFDFTGTSLPHPGNLNANPAIVWSVVLYVLRLLCKKDINLNEGLTKQVRLKLPNSFLNPRFHDNAKKCPAVVGGNTEISQRMTDTLLKAFNLSACSQGTMNNFLFGNDRYSYYETIGGGVGAGAGFKGRSAIHQHMTNTKITDPEELELRYPVQVDHFKIRKDSGGHGKFNGGDGISRQIQFLEPMTVTIIAQHRNTQPYGKQGGGPGATGQDFKITDGNEIKLNAYETFDVKIGEAVRIETPGGGAWGHSKY